LSKKEKDDELALLKELTYFKTEDFTENVKLYEQM